MLTVVKGFNQDVKNEAFYDSLILPVTSSLSHLAGMTGLMDALDPTLSKHHSDDIVTGCKIPPFYYHSSNGRGYARLILASAGYALEDNLRLIYKMVEELYGYGHRKILIPCFKSDSMFIETSTFIEYMNQMFGVDSGVPDDLHIYAQFNAGYLVFDTLPPGVEYQIITERAPRPQTRNNTTVHFSNMSRETRMQISDLYNNS